MKKSKSFQTEVTTKGSGMENKTTLVALWIEGDYPEDFDWRSVVKDGVNVVEAEAQRFEGELNHISIVYITRPLNLTEWAELSDKQDEVIFNVVGEEAFVMAGPLPEE